MEIREVGVVSCVRRQLPACDDLYLHPLLSQQPAVANWLFSDSQCIHCRLRTAYCQQLTAY
jgi:hypothetical protein